MQKTLKRPAPRKARRKFTAKDKPVATGLKDPFVFANLPEIAPFPCPCGQSRRAFRRPDNTLLSLHMVEISSDSRTHYHKGQTETYYFLEGEGTIELDGKRFPVKPGMALMIRPGTRHRAIPAKGPLKILNIVSPPFDETDEWFDEEQ